MLSELIRFRRYIWANALAELRYRYAGSALGVSWLVFFPAAQIAVYSVVFSQIMQARLPAVGDLPMGFTLYLCAGLLPWLAFTEIITRASGALLNEGSSITRLAVPEQVLFARDACIGLVIMMISTALLLGLCLVAGSGPRGAWILLPGILILFSVLGLGLGALAGVLHVFSRDVGPAVSILLQIWMWSTPIVYSVEILPEWARMLLVWNPAFPFVDALHGIVLVGALPEPAAWAWMAGLALLSLGFGLGVLDRFRGDVRDQL